MAGPVRTMDDGRLPVPCPPPADPARLTVGRRMADMLSRPGHIQVLSGLVGWLPVGVHRIRVAWGSKWNDNRRASVTFRVDHTGNPDQMWAGGDIRGVDN
jgi:hypothetical protein